MSPSNAVDPNAWERIRAVDPEGAQAIVDDPTAMARLAGIMAVSRALTRVLQTDPLALASVSSPFTAGAEPEDVSGLASWCRREMLRLAVLDVDGSVTLEEVGARLAELAARCAALSLRFTPGTDELTVVGMGKLGGRELNYSSDIDLMLVGRCSAPTARSVIDKMRACFRVDLGLRPEGNAGALVRTTGSYEEYWRRWASTWEFQALLKARAIAGNDAIGDEWTSAAQQALWSRNFGPDELGELSAMKTRTELLVASSKGGDREVKRGSGGIRDVEFTVQKLQLVHGGSDWSIRSATTLTALAQLSSGGYIDPADAELMSSSYGFLRTVEHRLQLVELQQTHSVPPTDLERAALARGMGMSLPTFDDHLRTCRAEVRQAYQRLYFRPLLGAFAGTGVLGSESLDTRVKALGFTDTKRTQAAVDELTRGLTRSSRLMQQLLPLLLQWLSEAPDPDGGLMALRRTINGARTPSKVVSAFRDSPEVARRLCLLLGTSNTFASQFERHPELFDSIGNREVVGSHDDIRHRLRSTLAWRQAASEVPLALMRFDEAERARISMSDVLELEPERSANRSRTALADAVLAEALAHVAPEVPVALIAMGSYGGNELSPASDLDVIVVHGGSGPEDRAEAERVAKRLRETVGSSEPGRRMYMVDYDLRPEGKQGPLARSIESCARYYEQWASTWERQALIRARPAAGDTTVAGRFMDIADPFVWGKGLTTFELKDIRQLKARMEGERMPRQDDSRFHLKLGKGGLTDVEWSVQLIQLQHGVRGTETVVVLPQLREMGLLGPNDAQALEDAWEFCQRVRNRASLIEGRAVGSLPLAPAELVVLARSLRTSPTELREQYMRVTRRCRTVMEKLFYGKVEE